MQGWLAAHQRTGMTSSTGSLGQIIQLEHVPAWMLQVRARMLSHRPYQYNPTLTWVQRMICQLPLKGTFSTMLSSDHNILTNCMQESQKEEHQGCSMAWGQGRTRERQARAIGARTALAFSLRHTMDGKLATAGKAAWCL